MSQTSIKPAPTPPSRAGKQLSAWEPTSPRLLFKHRFLVARPPKRLTKLLRALD